MPPANGSGSSLRRNSQARRPDAVQKVSRVGVGLAQQAILQVYFRQRLVSRTVRAYVSPDIDLACRTLFLAHGADGDLLLKIDLNRLPGIVSGKHDFATD